MNRQIIPPPYDDELLNDPEWYDAIVYRVGTGPVLFDMLTVDIRHEPRPFEHTVTPDDLLPGTTEPLHVWPVLRTHGGGFDYVEPFNVVTIHPNDFLTIMVRPPERIDTAAMAAAALEAWAAGERRRTCDPDCADCAEMRAREEADALDEQAAWQTTEALDDDPGDGDQHP